MMKTWPMFGPVGAGTTTFGNALVGLSESEHEATRATTTAMTRTRVLRTERSLLHELPPGDRELPTGRLVDDPLGSARSNRSRSCMFRRSAVVLTITMLLVTLLNMSPASAAEAGRDISFPQCTGALPHVRDARFAVLGANGGRAYTKNPCLARQLRW